MNHHNYHEIEMPGRLVPGSLSQFLAPLTPEEAAEADEELRQIEAAEAAVWGCASRVEG